MYIFSTNIKFQFDKKSYSTSPCMVTNAHFLTARKTVSDMSGLYQYNLTLNISFWYQSIGKRSSFHLIHKALPKSAHNKNYKTKDNN